MSRRDIIGRAPQIKAQGWLVYVEFNRQLHLKTWQTWLNRQRDYHRINNDSDAQR